LREANMARVAIDNGRKAYKVHLFDEESGRRLT
jgi:hypothetical protein